jgi:3-phenylpropionate/trans-cinnamate dioxygenase ferredoxin subunit
VTAVRVCRTGDVEPGSVRRFDVDGHRLCVVHLGAGGGDGAWYVIGDRCSHADFSLSEGELWPEEREIECPKHGSTFSLETGEPQTLPATQPVPVYPVTVDGDDVLVELPGEPGDGGAR